jgi:hypothetical protein
MNIHFRTVDGEEAVFLELNGAFDRYEATDCLACLPGKPLEYGDVLNQTIRRLQEKHFLTVTADEDDSHGTVELRLPPPLELFQVHQPAALKKAWAWVNAEAMNLPDVHSFAHWWEYVRRSEVFRRDCLYVRKLLAKDKGLAWAAFTGWMEGFLMAGSTSRESRTTAINAFVQKNFSSQIPALGSFMRAYINSCDMGPGQEKRLFRYKWKLPECGMYVLAWPEMSSEDVLAVFYALYGSDEEVCKLISYPNNKREKNLQGYVEYSIVENQDNDGHEICFYIPTISTIKSNIFNDVAHSRLNLTNFKEGLGIKYSGERGICFKVKINKNKTEKEIDNIIMKVLKIVEDSIKIPLPSLKTYKMRRRVDNKKMYRELAAFDRRVGDYSKFWETTKQKSLNDMVRKARDSANERISQIENHAEDRELAHPAFHSNRR